MSVLCSVMFCNGVQHTVLTKFCIYVHFYLSNIYCNWNQLCVLPVHVHKRWIFLMFFQCYMETWNSYLCKKFHSTFCIFCGEKILNQDLLWFIYIIMYTYIICWYWFPGLAGCKHIILKAMSNQPLESSWLICPGNFRLDRIPIGIGSYLEIVKNTSVKMSVYIIVLL